MTYLGFHALFIIPCIVLLITDAVRHRADQDGAIYRGIAVIIGLAVLYATPWDNWLVMESIWTYAPSAVIATLGYVPVEEYLFFVLQPLLTGLWLRAVLLRHGRGWVEAKHPSIVWTGAVGWLAFGILSGFILVFAESTWRYFAMIGVWVAPILSLQWAVGGAQLWANRGIWAWGIIPPTIYLGIVDRVAIGAGVWHITEATSTGWFIFGLPVEEFLFFLFTNIMIVQGVFLFVWVWETGRLQRVYQHLTFPIPPRNSTISDKTYQTIQRVVIRPGTLVFALVTFLLLLPIQVPIEAQLIPLMLSAVLIGLPHGAIDHLVPGMMAGKHLHRYQMTVLLGGYLSLVAIVLGLWVLSPLAGFVFFIALTWWHWGSADLHATVTFHRATFLDTKLTRLLTAFVRGGLPMLVPFLFFADDYRLALESITALFTTTSIDPSGWFFSNQFRLTAGAVFITVVGMTSILTFPFNMTIAQRQQWMIHSAETALLGVFFAIVPPFLAIGLYFCLWHSARHIARLILIDSTASGDDVDVRQFGEGFLRFTKSAMPLTLVSLLFLVALYFVVPSKPDNALTLIALYLVLISALTLPHSLIVLWMDRVQGVWHPMRQAASQQYVLRPQTGRIAHFNPRMGK